LAVSDTLHTDLTLDAFEHGLWQRIRGHHERPGWSSIPGLG